MGEKQEVCFFGEIGNRRQERRQAAGSSRVQPQAGELSDSSFRGQAVAPWDLEIDLKV